MFENIILLIACFMLAIIIADRAAKNRVLEKAESGLSKTAAKLTERAAQRKELEEQLQREEGNREKHAFLYRLDSILIRSGIKKKLGFVNAEQLIMLTLLLMSVTIYFTQKFTDKLMLSAAVSGAVLFAIILLFRVLLHINSRAVENGLLEFINLLDAYSRTSDDLIAIFGRASLYLQEPMKTGVMECYNEAVLTGDVKNAFYRLDIKMGNRKLSELLQNLELASRHEADYCAVIKSSQKQIKEYLAEKAIQREIVNAGRIQIAVLMAIGSAIMAAASKMAGTGILEYLTQDVAGMVLLAFLLFILFYGLMQLATGQVKEE